MPVKRDPIERAIEKIAIAESGCFPWTAGTYGTFPLEYGKFWNGQDNEGAHRFIYRTFVGPIPDELVLDHICRNTICVNPDHLEPVTQQENVLRGESLAAQNAIKTHCPQGHVYDEKNTYVSKEGSRRCRQCNLAFNTESYHKQRDPSSIQNVDKTSCPQGHPYSEENTHINKAGSRTCRICNRAKIRRSYWKKKNALR